VLTTNLSTLEIIHMARLVGSAVSITALLLCLARGAGAQADPDRSVAGGGTMPAGWHARTDGNRPIANVKFADMGRGHHVTLGPATIFWRDADTVSGQFGVEATVWQFASDTHRDHREGFGLFIGGRDLDGAGQRYTYFLIRDDGQFLVKRRQGDSTWTVQAWTPSAAIVNPAPNPAPGASTENVLAIRVGAGSVSFLVNGKEVYTTERSNVDSDGVAGYRMNHNLNVHLGPLVKTP